MFVPSLSICMSQNFQSFVHCSLSEQSNFFCLLCISFRLLMSDKLIRFALTLVSSFNVTSIPFTNSGTCLLLWHLCPCLAYLQGWPDQWKKFHWDQCLQMCLLIGFSFLFHFLRNSAWYSSNCIKNRSYYKTEIVWACASTLTVYKDPFVDHTSMHVPLWLETTPTGVLSLSAVAPISLNVLTCCCDNSHAWQIFMAPSNVRLVFLRSHFLIFFVYYTKHDLDPVI